MSDLEIRIADEKDIPSIISLYKELVMGSEKPISQDAAKEIFRKIRNNLNHEIYVAILNNEIVGTYALLFIDSFAHEGATCAVVEDVAVDKKCQGKGIGKKMMQHAMEVCANKGCYKMALSSSLQRDAAHNFYESLGFEKHGYSFAIKI